MSDAHDQLLTAKWFEWGCWAFCLIIVVLMLWSSRYPTLPREGITTLGVPQVFWVTALVVSVIVAVPLSGWAQHHTEWVEGWIHRCLFGGLMVVVLTTGCVYGGLVANGALDRGKPSVVETVVVGDESYFSGRRRKQRWRILVSDWRGGSDGVQKFDVTKSRYDNTTKGDKVRVITRPGALGWEWLVSFK